MGAVSLGVESEVGAEFASHCKSMGMIKKRVASILLNKWCALDESDKLRALLGSIITKKTGDFLG